MKKKILLWITFMVLGMTACSAEDEQLMDWTTLHTFGEAKQPETLITVQNLMGVDTLVLPSNVEPEAVELYFENTEDVKVLVKGKQGKQAIENGQSLDLTKLCEEENYTLTIQGKKGFKKSEKEIRFVFTSEIPAMYLSSDDSINEGRAWVESSEDKSNKATGSLFMQNGDGTVVYEGALTQIKGRGNSTWGYDKKPYQIKLEEKTDLLQTENEKNASKTWVLLANYVDVTQLRNAVALGLGAEIGMTMNVENQYVDLYYDGEYRGCYLLTEKVEVGKGRVAIENLDDLNEEVNAGTDIEDLPTATAVTANGATYTYCEGMQSPEDITGGYLLEMDFPVRAVEEVSYFYTTRGNYVVVKSPEFASKEEMEYIASLYQEYEDAVYHEGINPNTGKSYSDYVNADSIAQCYLINEFAKNRDGFSSSTYLYKEAGEDQMYMGPLWDYDLSLGIGGGDLAEAVSAKGLLTARTGMGAELIQIPAFKEKIQEIYERDFYPVVVQGLESLENYCAGIEASIACNDLLWVQEQPWAESVNELKEFCEGRAEYLKDIFAKWHAEDFVPPVDYVDVSDEAWYYEAAQKAAHYGFIVGVGGDTFAPDTVANRAQAIQVLYSMSGNPITAYEAIFADVSQEAWYSLQVVWAARQGIVKETENFRPDDVVTREELLTFLYNYCGAPEMETQVLENYADADTISEEAGQAIAWAIEEEIIAAEDTSLIRAQDGTTRAEMAAMVVNFYEKYIK